MSGKPNKKNEVGSLMKTASRRLGGGKSTPLDFVYSETPNAIHNSAKILPNLTRKTKKSNKMCHVHGRKKDCLTVTPVVYSKTANAIHKKVDVHDKSKNAIHISVDDAESIIAMLDWLKYMMCQECGKRCECDNRCIVARKAEQIIKNLRSKI